MLFATMYCYPPVCSFLYPFVTDVPFFGLHFSFACSLEQVEGGTNELNASNGLIYNVHMQRKKNQALYHRYYYVIIADSFSFCKCHLIFLNILCRNAYI